MTFFYEFFYGATVIKDYGFISERRDLLGIRWGGTTLLLVERKGEVRLVLKNWFFWALWFAEIPFEKVSAIRLCLDDAERIHTPMVFSAKSAPEIDGLD
jgi:hypothetical protein